MGKYNSDIEPLQFLKEVTLAADHNIPVVFYTWFGAKCAVGKDWNTVNGEITFYKDGLSDSKEKEELSQLNSSGNTAVLKCAPCYQTIIDLHVQGVKTLTQLNPSEHHSAKLSSGGEAELKDRKKIGALVYFVGWSSPTDSRGALAGWQANYQSGKYQAEKPNRVPFIWFEDLLDFSATSENISEQLSPLNTLPNLKLLQSLCNLKNHEEKEDSELIKELRRNLKRASGGSDAPHHISVVITGKEILALILRSIFGGVTADTTVLPARVGAQYNSRAEAGAGERFVGADLISPKEQQDQSSLKLLCTEDSWGLLKREDHNQTVTENISEGLNRLFQRTHALGPTQNRNTGGVVYEGQPRDLSTDTGYVITQPLEIMSLFSKEKTSKVVVTYDFKSKDGGFLTFNQLDKRLPNADLIDVFFNYTPCENKEYAELALSVFLTGMLGMREGENENLLTYNAFRGPATLSAAMTEYVISQEGQTEEMVARNYGRVLSKTGKVVDVTYSCSSEDNAPLFGYGESRNPTPDQMKQHGKRRDIIGKDGYMLFPELGLVKIWSGSWKASTEYAIATTPTKIKPSGSFSDALAAASMEPKVEQPNNQGKIPSLIKLTQNKAA